MKHTHGALLAVCASALLLTSCMASGDSSVESENGVLQQGLEQPTCNCKPVETTSSAAVVLTPAQRAVVENKGQAALTLDKASIVDLIKPFIPPFGGTAVVTDDHLGNSLVVVASGENLYTVEFENIYGYIGHGSSTSWAINLTAAQRKALVVAGEAWIKPGISAEGVNILKQAFPTWTSGRIHAKASHLGTTVNLVVNKQNIQQLISVQGPDVIAVQGPDVIAAPKVTANVVGIESPELLHPVFKPLPPVFRTPAHCMEWLGTAGDCYSHK